MPGGSIVHCPEFAYIATPIVLNVYLFTVFVRMTRSTGYSLLLLLRWARWLEPTGCCAQRNPATCMTVGPSCPGSHPGGMMSLAMSRSVGPVEGTVLQTRQAKSSSLQGLQ